MQPFPSVRPPPSLRKARRQLSKGKEHCCKVLGKHVRSIWEKKLCKILHFNVCQWFNANEERQIFEQNNCLQIRIIVWRRLGRKKNLNYPFPTAFGQNCLTKTFRFYGFYNWLGSTFELFFRIFSCWQYHWGQMGGRWGEQLIEREVWIFSSWYFACAVQPNDQFSPLFRFVTL